MIDQIQPDSVISLESASMEFSNAFSLTIARLVTQKLELLEQNVQLRAYIANQEKQHKITIAELKVQYKAHVIKSNEQNRMDIAKLEQAIKGLECEVNLLNSTDGKSLNWNREPELIEVIPENANDSYDSS